jgi:hypothetical protein
MQNQKKDKHVAGSWKNKIVNSDLQEERDKCDFDAKLGNGVFACMHEPSSERFNDSQEFIGNDPIL